MEIRSVRWGPEMGSLVERAGGYWPCGLLELGPTRRLSA